MGVECQPTHSVATTHSRPQDPHSSPHCWCECPAGTCPEGTDPEPRPSAACPGLSPGLWTCQLPLLNTEGRDPSWVPRTSQQVSSEQVDPGRTRVWLRSHGRQADPPLWLAEAPRGQLLGPEPKPQCLGPGSGVQGPYVHLIREHSSQLSKQILRK